MMIKLRNQINPYGIDYPLCLEDPNPYGNSISGSEDPATHISAQASQLLQYLYPYDLSYRNRRYLRQDVEFSFASASTIHDGVGGDSIVQTNYLPCSKKYFTDYLNSGQEVLDAIHARLVIHSDNNNGDGTPSSSTPLWKECANDIHYSREDFMTPVVDLYRKLLVGEDHDDGSLSRNERDLYFFRKGDHSSHGNSFSSHTLKSMTGGRKDAKGKDDKGTNSNGDGIRMLVFSGDDDSVCSTAGTQTWIWGLGVEPKSDNDTWQPWTRDDGQVAGYVTRFDMSPHFDRQKKDSNHFHRHGDDYGRAVVSSFSFVTVRGAGHEVPSYRPKQALEVFRKFLNGEW